MNVLQVEVPDEGMILLRHHAALGNDLCEASFKYFVAASRNVRFGRTP